MNAKNKVKLLDVTEKAKTTRNRGRGGKKTSERESSVVLEKTGISEKPKKREVEEAIS